MKKTNTETALKTRYPEGVALVVCKDEKSQVDITPIGWFMLCNSTPQSWAISLYHKHFSHHVISKTKEFTLCLPSYKQKKDILYCGSVSGWNEDKLKKCSFRISSSTKIQVPLIEDCIACYECKVIKTTTLPDHTIFVGEILVSYVSERTDKIYNLGNRSLFLWERK